MSRKLLPLFLSLTPTLLHAGFYAGAGLGSDTVNFGVRSRVINAAPSQPVGFDVLNKAHLASTGVFGTLFGGYGGMLNQAFYLAGEINGNISSTSAKGFNHEFVHATVSDTALKIKNSLGVSVLPGYLLTETSLLYARLGFTNSKIQQQTSDISLANFSKRKTGFRYGLGIQQALNEQFALRMDYSRIDYHTFTTGTFDPVGIVAKSTQITPRQQLIEFSLMMQFA